MTKYPYKCWCGQVIEFAMDDEFHDCNAWESLVLEQEYNEKL